MQEGMIADITIFNPETIADNADMKIGNRATPPTGIPHVIVSGQFVVRDGNSILGARPGKPVRYAPISNGDIVIDFDDKRYQWHADLPEFEDPRRDN